jgi:DNA-binding NarL/FixJ family response regulator
MNAAIAITALPSWAPPVASVVGASAQAREQATTLLGAAGFALRPAPSGGDPTELVEPGTLIVALGTGTAAERLRALRALAEANPHAQLVVTMPDDAPNSTMRRALRAGASGIVLDGAVGAALVPTAKAVVAGQLAVPCALRSQLAPRPLSYREKQVLGLVVLGLTNREIADKLYLAESTVKTHLSSAFAKLDAHSRAEAAARILDPESGYGVGILALGNGAPTPVH